MQIIRSWAGLDMGAKGATVAIGNFDGVHLGHQAVIDIARAACDAPLGVLTFEPHPREFFAPETPPFRLMNARARANRLARLGVSKLYELPFDETLAGLSAEAFAQTVLADGLGARHAVVGADFCFGKGRSGTATMLRRFGAQMGFGVTVADLLTGSAGRVSSTAIRAALAAGQPRVAAEMLGHWHRIEGPVQHGEKRGRELGYPTANMGLEGLHLPRFGVYAVLADVLDGPHRGSYRGAASLGVRPQFGVSVPNLETFLFDFSGDLYGATLSIALVDFLRPEARFADVPALVTQMADDCARARQILEDF